MYKHVIQLHEVLEPTFFKAKSTYASSSRYKDIEVEITKSILEDAFN